MEVFSMISQVFSKFGEIGILVNFGGLNLFEISFIVFVLNCIVRWVYPIIFSGFDGGLGSAKADSVSSRSAQYRNVKVNNSPSIPLRGHSAGALNSALWD